MALLSKSLPEGAPTLFHKLANCGYDLSTLRGIYNVISGLESPTLNETRTQVSMLLELQSLIGNTIAASEAEVLLALSGGQEVKGYKSTTRKQRKYNDAEEFVKWAERTGHPEFIKAPEPIGFTALDKILKNQEPEVVDIVESFVDTTESSPTLRRL